MTAQERSKWFCASVSVCQLRQGWGPATLGHLPTSKMYLLFEQSTSQFVYVMLVSDITVVSIQISFSIYTFYITISFPFVVGLTKCRFESLY